MYEGGVNTPTMYGVDISLLECMGVELSNLEYMELIWGLNF